MSHQIKTPAGNRVWSLLLSDHEDEIEEQDIIDIEAEAGAALRKTLLRLANAIGLYHVAIGRAPANYRETEAISAFSEMTAALKEANRLLADVVGSH